MGLQRKRRIAEYKETLFPEYTKRLKEECDIDLAMDADWDSFDEQALNYFENQGLSYISYALKDICRDKIGKEAFAEKNIKKILFKNHPDAVNNKAVIVNDTIELHGGWGNDSWLGQSDIVTELENQL